MASPAQERAAASIASPGTTNTSLVLSNTALLAWWTNLSHLTDRLGLDLQVDNLKLDLNGFAVVGLHNVLTNLSAQQTRTDEGSPLGRLHSSGVSDAAPGAGLPDSRLTITPTALSNACVVLNGLSFCLATNMDVELGTRAFRIHVGNLELRLNGFALLGATNLLEGLTTRQELPPVRPAENPRPPPPVRAKGAE